MCVMCFLLCFAELLCCSAAKAKKGDYKEAQLQVRAAQRLMQRKGDDEKLQVSFVFGFVLFWCSKVCMAQMWSKNVAGLDSALNEQQGEQDVSRMEAHNNNNNNNNNNSNDDNVGQQKKKLFKKKQGKDKDAVVASKMTTANEADLFN
jgi:hypothetical protein